jgi:hypothetical protein
VSGAIEFVDPDPGPVPEGDGPQPDIRWRTATVGWAVAAGLVLVAPFFPFAVYPRWRGGPGTAAITLKEVSLNGWTRGEEPTVGIVLLICAALFAANAIAPLFTRRSGAAFRTERLDRWMWAGVVAAPAILLGVVSMLVLYLLTGTTRRAQILVPAAHSAAPAVPVRNGGTAVPVSPPVHAIAGAAGGQFVQIVRSSEILRSGCLWLTVAAAASALAALVIQIGSMQLTPASSP